MSHLKPVPTPDPNSLTPEEQRSLLRKDESSGSFILECWKPRPYLAVLTPSRCLVTKQMVTKEVTKEIRLAERGSIESDSN